MPAHVVSRRPWFKVVTLVLRYGLSLAALLWLAQNTAWRDFRALAELEADLLIPAIVVAGLAYPLQAWRWQLLLRAQGISPPTAAVHRAFWVGHFYNSFLPGGVAGDAVRFAWLWQVAPERRAGGAASLVMDRLLGLATLCALAAIGLGLHLATRGGSPPLLSLLAGSGVAVVAIIGVWWLAARGGRWEGWASRLLGPSRGAALQSLSQAFRVEPAALGVPLVLSLAIWLLDFISLWMLAQAVGLHASLMAVTIAAAAAYAAAALPISVGGHGVREAALVAVLALFGLGEAGGVELTTLALAFWALTVAWALVGGLVCLYSFLSRSVCAAQRA